MNTVITKKEYQALKENGLNFQEVAKKYLTDTELKEINFLETLNFKPEEGGSFANFGSFAYWKNSTHKKAFDQANENIQLLQDWDKIQEENVELKAGYVLLGVNAGLKGMNLKELESFEHFEMFQIRSLKKNNKSTAVKSPIRYKNALINTGNEVFYNEVVSGTYMTDFIKGLPTPYGPDIKKNLKKITANLKYSNAQFKTFYSNFCKLFGEILNTELQLLGGKTHTLIVMGKNPKTCIVNEFLKESGLDQQYNVVNISHYSGSPKQVDLVEELKNAYSIK